MRLSLFTAIATTVATAFALPAFAQTKDAAEFHELLRSAIQADQRGEEALSMIHMLPDQTVLQALQAKTAADAVKIANTTTLEKLSTTTAANLRNSNVQALDADEILAKNPITIVIVPGIFGEFIPTRAFEDVLSQPSVERDQFLAKVTEAKQKLSPNATDLSYDIESNSKKEFGLDELVNVGSLKNKEGKTVARVVLLFTRFMSLESMGDLKSHAELFNRRLSKYLALTGPQKMAFVGYSRGTVLGLEMLSQAQEKKAPWLKDVNTMISLGGVTWGSALADDTTTQNSAANEAISALKTLTNDMDENSKTRTLAAWGRFLATFAKIVPRLAIHPNPPRASDLKAKPVGGGTDAMSVLRLAGLVYTHLGLTRPFADFGPNVKRFQSFVREALSGVDSLTSSSRRGWWRTHTLPKNVRYLALTASMANPEVGAFDKSAFDGPFGYSARSFDDLSLLQNRLDYEKIGGIAMNDSQVSVPQAAFLPNAIAELNPANAGLKTEFLGIAGTHHWGLALKVVNAMKDGRTNPFPREALLKALAAKSALALD